MSIEETDQLQTALKSKPFFTRTAVIKILLTLAFYVAIWGMMYILDLATPGDMCNPGGGFFILMYLPLPVIFITAYHLVKTIRGSRSDMIPTIIHSIVLAAYLVIFLLLLSH